MTLRFNLLNVISLDFQLNLIRFIVVDVVFLHSKSFFLCISSNFFPVVIPGLFRFVNLKLVPKFFTEALITKSRLRTLIPRSHLFFLFNHFFRCIVFFTLLNNLFELSIHLVMCCLKCIGRSSTPKELRCWSTGRIRIIILRELVGLLGVN